MEFFLSPFLITGLVGLLLTALAFWVTWTASPIKRVALLSFLLATTVTPTIVVHHAIAVAPATWVLVVSPFAPMYGWTYGLLFGLLPICFVWMAIGSIWLAMGVGQPQKS
jgi:hypothetical protein